MLRVMLDSCVFDELLKDSAARAALQTAIADGKVQVLTSHIQRDELDAIRRRDPEKADRLLEVWTSLTSAVPTAGAVWDVSRWGEARWFGDEQAARFDNTMRTPAEGTADGRPGHTNDALIVDTARHEEAVFVTVEKDRAKKMARRVGVPILSSAELLAMVDRGQYGRPESTVD
jgi:hypothetical protein